MSIASKAARGEPSGHVEGQCSRQNRAAAGQPMEGLRKPREVCGARTGQNGKGPELTRVLFGRTPLAVCGDHTEEGTGRRVRRLWRT